jgi:hypothetical protein
VAVEIGKTEGKNTAWGGQESVWRKFYFSSQKNHSFQTRTGSSLEDVEGQEESGSSKEMSSALRRNKIDSLSQQASAKESAKV